MPHPKTPPRTPLLWVAMVAASLVPTASAAQEPAPAPTPTPAAPSSPSPGGPPAQKVAAPERTGPVDSLTELTEVAPPEEAFTLRYGNRPIVVFRGRALGRTPVERAAATVRRLDELADQDLVGPVDSRLAGGLAILSVAGREAVTILPTDLDPLTGETLEAAAREAAGHLERAMAEVIEARSPVRLLHSALRALGATLIALALGWLFWWVRRRVARRLPDWLETHLARPLERRARGDVWRMVEVGLLVFIRFVGRVAAIALAFLIAYVWLTLVLRQFPYTRPWGEALRGFVISTVLTLGRGMLAAIPGLFTVVLIVVITRVLVRITNAFFGAVQQGRLTLPGLYADTAQPTRRLVVALLWLFAVVVAYPYLPGSGTDAFKGVSVFVGLMVSLGSSGLVNQAMSSFMITYSRALRLGDYVRVGDVEGTVVHAGVLSTKIRTRRNEEVTFPNAVVASSTITNFSRYPGEGVFVRTAVTIGYDTPWRQVEAMLLEAASRTAGVGKQPPPRVLQTALQDFYVEYTVEVALAAAPERPEERLRVLSELHRHIQDAFNENGVQIMSPHYRADPSTPKVVPKADWFAPPAKPGTDA